MTEITLYPPLNPSTGKYDSLYIPDDWIAGDPPTISSMSGTFANGNTITLTGGNFSKKRQGQVFFTDFASDTVGQQAAGLTYFAGSEPNYLVDNTQSPPLGTKSIRLEANLQNMGTTTYEFAANTDEVFFEVWSRVNPVLFHQPNTWSIATPYSIWERVKHINPQNGLFYNYESKTALNTGNTPCYHNGTSYVVDETNWLRLDQPQVKLFRVVDGTGTDSGQGRPVGMLAILEADGALYAQSEDGGLVGGHSGYGTMPPSNTWVKYTYYVKRGALDVANGQTYLKVGSTFNIRSSSHPAGGHMASPSGAIPATQYTYAGTSFVNNETGKTNQGLYYRRIFMTYFHRSYQHTIVDIAHMFINDSPERVVIGDAATWNACDHTKTYTCKSISRDTTTLSFTAATSSNITGALYAYVVNRDGVYNTNGYQVRA